MQIWIEESLKNGELFFYIVPAVLLILLLIVIFWPDKKEKKEEVEETELDKLIKADKRLKAEIEPVEEDEPPFKPANIETPLFEDKTEQVQTFTEISPEPEETTEPAAEPVEAEPKSQPVETFPETSPEPEKTAEPQQEPIKEPEIEEKTAVAEPVEAEPEVEAKSEPQPVETSPETYPEPEKPAATIKSGLEKTKKGGFMSRLLGLFKNSVVDDDLIEELEEILYTAGMGVATVSWLMDLVNKNRSKFSSGDDVKQFLKEKIREVLFANHNPVP